MSYIDHKYDRPSAGSAFATFLFVLAVCVLVVPSVIIIGGSSGGEVRRLETENQRLEAKIRDCQADRDDALKMVRK